MSRETTCAGQGCGDCTVCRLRADVSRLEALRKHDIEAWQKEAVETTKLRAEVERLAKFWDAEAVTGVEKERAGHATDRAQLMCQIDAARAEVATLTANLAAASDFLVRAGRNNNTLRFRLSTVERERDEARAKVTEAKHRWDAMCDADDTDASDWEKTGERDKAKVAAWNAMDELFYPDGYLSRSPVEGGREMVTAAVPAAESTSVAAVGETLAELKAAHAADRDDWAKAHVAMTVERNEYRAEAQRLAQLAQSYIDGLSAVRERVLTNIHSPDACPCCDGVRQRL